MDYAEVMNILCLIFEADPLIGVSLIIMCGFIVATLLYGVYLLIER